MRKYIFIISVILLTGSMQAQVTVGSTNIPASFSVLQLDGVLGGLRLPQVTENDRDDINVTSLSAKGLLIYNTDTDWVDYWDGVKWSPVSEALTARNGLRFDNGKVKLGGTLIKSTGINLNGNTLNFVTNSSTFRINTNVLQLKGSDIKFQPTKFSVNTNVFSVAGSAITMLPYNTGSGKLIVNSGVNNKLTVNNQNVIQEGKMTYTDGKQATGNVLVASSTGDAYWAKLRPNTRVLNGALASNATITGNSTPTNPTIVDITSSTLDLTPGKWIIFVNYSTSSTAAADYNRRYVWTYLYKKPLGGTSSQEEFVTMVGSPTSINSSGRQSFSKLIYLVEVTENTSYIIKCGTRNRSTTYSSTLSAPTFMAMSVIEAGQ